MRGPSPKADGSNGGRDSAGRFTVGNSGGPGNPYARRVAALRSALLDSVTEEDLRGIARSLVEQAQGGDLAAAKLLLSYVVGRPPSEVDLPITAEPPLDLSKLSDAELDQFEELAGRVLR